ncbi:Histidine kinase [Paenibacillus nuruki]|uniref:Circadian input-output histidine kinase CikA n=1 Tax=Paenibacillus nuruki TaxID=1886670 RepID=A0A1E3L3U7_9BACL|nr:MULTISPECIES: ATP-binding protein [Paenibacillus]ODP28354.1 Histidine kinase [Paenibacillus nuruki]TKJ91016.1 sensor histidine kinase [Paenibacillus sp. CFBP13512]
MSDKDLNEWTENEKNLQAEIERLQLLADERLEAKVKAEKADENKSSFIAMLSHEIRTPMNGIITMADLLQQTSLDEEQTRYNEIIQSSSEALMTLVDNLLDISKMEAGKMSLEQYPFDLINTIEDLAYVLSPTAFEKKVQVILDVETDIPLFVIGDALKVRQIFMNILQNAIKFTHSGEILISLFLLSTVKEEDIHVKIVLRDTGIGMSEKQLGVIFDSYAQGHSNQKHHYGGTGLGLAITKSLVELMGGQVYVKSELGVGTEFSVEIRFDKYTDLPSIPFEKNILANINIMVLDSNLTSLELMTNTLQGWGARVATSLNMDDSFIDNISRHSYDICLIDHQTIDFKKWDLELDYLKKQRMLLMVPLGNKIDEDFKGRFETVITKPIRKLHLLNSILALQKIKKH